jgi:hypothetical protein
MEAMNLGKNLLGRNTLAQYQNSAAHELLKQMKYQTSMGEAFTQGLKANVDRYAPIKSSVLDRYTGGYGSLVSALTLESNIPRALRYASKGIESWQSKMGHLGAALDITKSVNQVLSDQSQKLSSMAEVVKSLSETNPVANSRLYALTKELGTIQKSIVPNYMKEALAGVSLEIASEINQSEDWGSSKYIQEVTEEIIGVGASILEEETVTVNDLQKLYEVLAEVKEMVVSLKPNWKNKILTFMTVIGFIITMINEGKKYIGSSDSKAVTTDQLIEWKNEILVLIEQGQQDRLSNSLVTERDCYVRVNHFKKSHVIECLPARTHVLKISTHHKWAYIGYRDFNDSLPKHGWILKKYLPKVR